jgi:PKD repeat protein
MEGDTLRVAASLRNTGSADSGPVTAAFFATAEGWGDWYLGSTFVANLAAGGAATSVQIDWKTSGFQGDVPVKVVVNPTRQVTETVFTNNTAQTSVRIEPPTPMVADFTASPTSGIAPLTVQFTATTSSNVTSWLWDFGDNTSSTTRNPSHRYSATGVYTVTLTGSGADGSDREVKANYIAVSLPQPPVAAFAASPTGGPAPLTVNFANQSREIFTAQQWQFGDGGSSTARNPSYTYANSGVYTVTLTVTGPGGSSTKSIPDLITVSPGQTCVDVPLAAGWNLLALPVQPAGTAPAAALAPLAGKYSLAFAYDACDAADQWKRYDPSAPPETNDLTALDLTRGVWVEMNSATTATFCGAAPQASTAIGLCPGWNLVGYPSSLRVGPPEALSPLNGCYDMVFGYRAADAADQWKRFDPASPPEVNDLQVVEPGFGLWINATQSCTWTVKGR